MGILDHFRMQDIFSALANQSGGGDNSQTRQQGVAPRQAPQQQEPDENIDVYDTPPVRPNYQYTPPFAGNEPTPAMDKFRGLLDTMPERPKPSILRQIGTGALSFVNAQKPDQITETVTPDTVQETVNAKGQKSYVTHKGGTSKVIKKGIWQPYDINETSKILNMPYEQELGDWQNKTKVTQQAAQLEKQAASDRALQAQRYAGAAAKPIETQVKVGNLDRLTNQGNAKLDQSQQRIQQNQQKIDQNQQKIDHVINREDLSDSEKQFLLNRYKQEQIQLKGDIDAARQEMQGSQRLDQIGAKGSVDKDIQELRGSQSMQQIGAKGEQARQTKEVVSPASGATSQLPTQQKVGLQNKAAKIIRDNPDWSNYISVDSNGQVAVQSPGRFSGPDKATYDKIVSALEGGEDVVDLTKPDGGAGPANTPNNAPPKSTKSSTTPKSGKVRVIAPDGRTGTWDYSKGPLPKGYKMAGVSRNSQPSEDQF